MQRTPASCTPTPPVPKTSWIDDEVIQLRSWGAETVYRMPADAQKLLIGTAHSCALQIHDHTNYMSRKHACLERVAEQWCIVDQSKNGLYIDGQLHRRCFLAPGMRINLGPRVTLVAESVRTIALRAALARMMGWRAELAESLDRAFQNLRLAPSGKAIFTLCGEGDLLMFAHELHQLTLGEHRPFVVVCGVAGTRQRRAHGEDHSEDIAKSAPRVSNGRDAITLARGGTICLDNRRLPNDVPAMFDMLRDGASPTQVFVLAKYVRKTEVYTHAPFVIPPLRARASEVDRLIAEYEVEARRRLGIDPELTAAQRERIRAVCKTLSDLQKATHRLIALRQAGTLRGAAALLNMSHVALTAWLRGRGLQGRVTAA